MKSLYLVEIRSGVDSLQLYVIADEFGQVATKALKAVREDFKYERTYEVKNVEKIGSEGPYGDLSLVL